MDFGSSDDDDARSGSGRGHPSLKRPRAETDEEDVSSASSTGSSVSSSDSEMDDRHALARRHPHAMAARRRGRPVRRGIGIGRARADDFVMTMRLMSEVEALRRQRDELMSLHYTRVLNTGSRDAIVNTTIEYFDKFRDGFCGPRVPEMIRFFNTRLDRDVFAYGGSNLGVDTWIEQWRRYTRIFKSLSMRLQSMSVIDLADSTPLMRTLDNDPTTATHIITTNGILDGIYTRQAVCTVFPHLRNREDLIQKLIGKSLNLPMNLRFYFNRAGRVIRYDLDGDYLQALSSYEDVDLTELSEIMEHVAIGENMTMPAPVELVDDEETKLGSRAPP